MTRVSMEPGEQDNAAGQPSAPRSEEDNCLQLHLHTDEAVWMRQIGHLKDWCSQTQSIKLGIPARVTTSLAADSIRLLFLFKNLQHLDITFNSTRSRIEQSVLVACAELLNLTTLGITGGHLARRGLDLSVLTSLRRLNTLSVRPHSDEELDGLEDEHLATAARLTGLTSLSLRTSENASDEGVQALMALTGLTQLSLVPMGLFFSREGMDALVAAMPRLASLSVGLHESRQVAALKGLSESPQRSPAISMVLNSPEVSTSGFFSTLTLVLRPRLVSLRMATVESTDASFLLAVGTLTQLTELKMGVSLAEGGQPFTCNLATMSSLSRLQTLEFAVTQDLRLPLSVKLVSMLALGWPQLRSLSLSVMTKPEVVPEALDLLDNFRHLTSLSLFAPLDYTEEEGDVLTLPVTPRYLPYGLTHLVLECAELRDPNPASPSLTAKHQPQTVGAGPAAAPSGTSAAALTATVTATAATTTTTGQSDGGATRGSAAAPAPVLPNLQHLELTSCRMMDDHLTTLLSSATGMRHLELSDVQGLTNVGLDVIRRLTRIEHLVMRLAPPPPPPPPLPSAGRGKAAKAPPPPPLLSHNSLAALRNAATLRHLEWSLPEPLGAAALEDFCSGVLPSLGNLQVLMVDIAPELRAGRLGPEPVGGAGKRPGAEQGSGGDGVAGAGNGALGWRERLQQALPLCTIAEQPGIVMYDLWNDRTVTVVGP